MPLEALPGYGAAPILSVREDKAWLDVSGIPSCFCTACVLNKYNAVEPLLKVAFLPWSIDGIDFGGGRAFSF